jgi:2-amino-4-hydroxy-6-hydroxymethyldihydropteridine diphosphokinase
MDGDAMHSTRQINQAVIGVGSNIDPQANIERAVAEIGKAHRVTAVSQWVRTKPVGFVDQPDFLNGAIRIETTFDLPQLRAWLRELESLLGRVRTDNKSGPRTIDLDVVVWNGRVIDEDFHRRDFLRKAVLEVWPEIE